MLLHESAQASLILTRGQQATAAAIAAWLLVLLFRRYRRMPPSRRRANAPVLCSAAAPIAVYLVTIALNATQTHNPAVRSATYWVEHLTVLVVPAAMIVGLLASRLARADVTALLLNLRSTAAEELQPALARVLGDPHTRIAILVPDPTATPRHIDPHGQPVTLPTDPHARTTIGDGVLLLHHPATRTEDPYLFDAAVARLTLDNVRLTAQVRAQLAEVHASRERLLRAGDEERRRLERDLHDGAQQRLIGLGMALRTARDTVTNDSPAAAFAALLDDATEQLRQSLTELRDLARGLRPAMLAERGLAVAVQTLLPRVPVPVTLSVDLPARADPAVETAAFFVIAEALQNSTRHTPAAHATITLRAGCGDGPGSDGRLSVTVSDNGPGGADTRAGTGLRGIADRVAAAGGHLTVTSPEGKGTTITADLPMHPHA